MTDSVDAVFVASHLEWYATPDTLPPQLEQLFRSNAIPLSTLRIVSLGPGNSYLVASGSRLWYDFQGLHPREASDYNDWIRKIAANTPEMTEQPASRKL